MEAGVDTDQLYQLIYQNERPERVVLQARAQQSLQLLAENRLAVMQVSRDDFLQMQAGSGDTEALINIPLQIRTVQVSVLVVEPLDGGPIRVSLRSKGQIDVSKFAAAVWGRGTCAGGGVEGGGDAGGGERAGGGGAGGGHVELSKTRRLKRHAPLIFVAGKRCRGWGVYHIR